MKRKFKVGDFVKRTSYPNFDREGNELKVGMIGKVIEVNAHGFIILDIFNEPSDQDYFVLASKLERIL